MAKRALVIGSQVRGLQGVDFDVQQMAEMLEGRGFQVDRRTGKRASRDGILEGYRQLAERSGAEDAAVVYYSGHGILTRNQTPAQGQPPWMQGIVPTDFDDSTTADYRGITSWELSLNLERLTRKTTNVTVLLDCCHSARLSRDGEARRATVRALERPTWANFGEHLAALRRLYAELGERPGALSSSWSNPHAVRLVACGHNESAHEYQTEGGVFHGAFTEALLHYLRTLDAQTSSWADLVRAVRERVQRLFPSQRPDVEGPQRRRPFSLETQENNGSAALVTDRRGQHQLRAGRLAGVSVGDVYSVMPVGSAGIEADREIARAMVLAVSASSSEVVVKEWHNQHTAIPRDAIALPRERAAPRRPVTLIAPAPARAELEEALSSTRALRLAQEEDGDTALATLRLDGAHLTVEDSNGPLGPPFRFPQQLKQAMRMLGDLGVAHGLRALEGEHGISEKRELTIELGKVEGSEIRTLPARGASVMPGEMICVRVCNRSFRNLHVHFFNLGVCGQVTMLSGFAPSGVVLKRDEFHVLGEHLANGEMEGLTVSFPAGISDTSRPLLDEILVIVTSNPANLSALETPEPDAERVITRNASSPLQQMLAQLQDGLPRDVAFRKSDDFLLKRLPFFIDARTPAERAAHSAKDASSAADDEPTRPSGSR